MKKDNLPSLIEWAKKIGIKVIHLGKIGVRINSDTPRPNILPRPQGK